MPTLIPLSHEHAADIDWHETCFAGTHQAGGGPTVVINGFETVYWEDRRFPLCSAIP